MHGERLGDYAILASHSLLVEKAGLCGRTVDEDGRVTTKPNIDSPLNRLEFATVGAPETGRERWPAWVNALHRFQLEGLAGWFLDTGRPVALVSAQILYMLTPFVGSEAERVGRLLESDRDSRAFLDLLGLKMGFEDEIGRDRPG